MSLSHLPQPWACFGSPWLPAGSSQIRTANRHLLGRKKRSFVCVLHSGREGVSISSQYFPTCHSQLLSSLDKWFEDYHEGHTSTELPLSPLPLPSLSTSLLPPFSAPSSLPPSPLSPSLLSLFSLPPLSFSPSLLSFPKSQNVEIADLGRHFPSYAIVFGLELTDFIIHLRPNICTISILNTGSLTFAFFLKGKQLVIFYVKIILLQFNVCFSLTSPLLI